MRIVNQQNDLQNSETNSKIRSSKDQNMGAFGLDDSGASNSRQPKDNIEDLSMFSSDFDELGAAHFINQERAQETSSHIHTLILSKEIRNLKKEKSWRLIGRTKTKENKANKIPETCKCNTQIERIETPTQKRKAYRPVQHSMDRPKSPKETLQQQQTHHTSMTTNSALPTSNNFIDLSM
ncbi:hypothetical protein H5410_052877 [Solanum commersonii]|uniref:Uncharacterized protein n=1 Tax=Solanum commersonii TaxID=4109 RepID=A0A9J5X2S1_SOLCO|nr:hypothetical protein H5410_052877 [Solanum commersonii]